MLWRRRRASIGIVLLATFSWLLIEYSGISFLSLCSDVLLILVVLLFLRANYAVLMNKYDFVLYQNLVLLQFANFQFRIIYIAYALCRELQTLCELVISEEMVNNAAASFRIKVNYMLLMAHDITHGKDFRLFFVVSSTSDSYKDLMDFGFNLSIAAT